MQVSRTAFGPPRSLPRPLPSFQEPSELGDRLGDVARVFIGLHQRRQLRDSVICSITLANACCLLDHRSKRPERDALPIWKAAAPEYRRALTQPHDELVREPRLADSGCAENGYEATAPFRHRSLQDPLELGEDVVAADKGSVQPRCCFRHRHDTDQPVRRDRLLLALELQRRHRLGIDRIANESERRLGQQDLSGLGVLLETSGAVRCIAGHEVAVGDEALAGDRPGVDPGPRRQDDAVALLEALVQAHERLSHLDRSPDGAQRVVLVQLGQAENGHHRVADELREHSAVPLDDRLDALEVVRQDMREGLRIESLPQTGRVDDIGEEDRDRLPELLR